jgi:hypothetical protein
MQGVRANNNLLGTQLNNSNLLALRTTLTIIVCVLSKLIIFIPSRVNEIVASVKMSLAPSPNCGEAVSDMRMVSTLLVSSIIHTYNRFFKYIFKSI